MPAPTNAPFERIRQQLVDGPVVVAHRGDSSSHAENTLAAFAAARQQGVPMQEFDVRATRDRVLCCLHDATFDRTTDAARILGPGALIAQTTWTETQRLDAGSWHGEHDRGQRVPTLAQALSTMLPDCIPLIEHKAGEVSDYVALLRQTATVDQCILQSFDWAFVGDAHAALPSLALAVLGPTTAFPQPDDDAIAAAKRIGAGMMHWSDRELTHEHIARVHAAGLLVCTYTTDHEVGWVGGAALGFDAMCTNRPGCMMDARRKRWLRRPSER
jgi:glycerophosphoryl diester phosphodiesterase